MTEHLRPIERQLLHLDKMRGYLEYSHRRIAPLMPIAEWTALSPEQHEMLAAGTWTPVAREGMNAWE